MFLPILDPEYEKVFHDTEEYLPATHFLVKGIAAVLNDCDSEWRPTLTDLVNLIQASGRKIIDPLVLAGSAYGLGKYFSDDFPGPALLLFTAAINGIWELKPVELRDNINRSKELLDQFGIRDNPDIQAILQAASQRAKMDMVRKLIKDELTEGLERSGRFQSSRISKAVNEIVDTSDRVRHEGLVDRFGFTKAFPSKGGIDFYDEEDTIREFGSTGIVFYNKNREELEYGISFLQYLIPYAQVGSAFSIYKKLEKLDIIPDKNAA